MLGAARLEVRPSWYMGLFCMWTVSRMQLTFYGIMLVFAKNSCPKGGAALAAGAYGPLPAKPVPPMWRTGCKLG